MSTDETKMEDEMRSSPTPIDPHPTIQPMELPPAEATFGSVLPFNPLQSLSQTNNQTNNHSINPINPVNHQSPPPNPSNNQSTNQLNLSTIAQLIDDLRSSDLSTRLSSFQSIDLISAAIGPLRTREELIPYLNEFIDDDDEVLLALGKKLNKNFVEYVGGSSFAHVLLTPLESLLSCEETLVRQVAIDSILEISNQMTELQVENYLTPLLRKLAADPFFTAKMSAAYLFPGVYSKVANVDKQKELRGIFLRLCQDETPMVKRAACECFGKAVEAVASNHQSHNQSNNQTTSQSGSPTSLSNQSVNQQIIKTEFFPIYLKLVKDDQDSVRLLTVDAAINLSINQSTSDQITKMLPVIFQLCADKSWRVRYMAALKFVDIVKAMSKQQSNNQPNNQSTPHLSDELLDSFVRLLSDDEAEVRTAAAKMIGDLSTLIGPVFTQRKLLAPCKNLVRDPSHFVRSALAGVFVQVAHTLNQTINQSNNQNNQPIAPGGTQLLLPLFLQLLRDQHSEVRLQLISKMDQSINQAFSQGQSNQTINQSNLDSLHSALLPAIRELAADPKWRVRLEIIDHIPKLALQFGSSFFDEFLNDQSINWCGDSVFSIRVAATKNLAKCVEQFGEEWARKSILPKILNLSDHRSYLYRLTCCNALKGMMQHLTLPSIIQPINQTNNQSILNVLMKLCEDPVPNVRFASCKALQEIVEIHPSIKQSNNQTITDKQIQELKNVLTKLEQDADNDVKYYAKRAAQAWK